MFKLDNPNLPLVATSKTGGGIICRTFGIGKEMAPIARINVLAQYQDNPGFVGDTINLPTPKYISKYYRFDCGLEVIDIDVPGFSIAEDSVTAIPGNIWLDGSTFNLYADNTLNNPFTINVKHRSLIPPRINNIFTFLLPDGFNVAAAESECLNVFPYLVHTENILEAHTHLLRTGADIDFTGELTLNVPEPDAIAVQFDLSLSELTTLYSVDFMGKTYAPATVILSPDVGEFLWDSAKNLLTIFLTVAQAQGL